MHADGDVEGLEFSCFWGNRGIRKGGSLGRSMEGAVQGYIRNYCETGRQTELRCKENDSNKVNRMLIKYSFQTLKVAIDAVASILLLADVQLHVLWLLSGLDAFCKAFY